MQKIKCKLRFKSAFSLVEMLMALLVASLLLAALAPVMTRKMNEHVTVSGTGNGTKSDYSRIFYEDFEWNVPSGVNIIKVTSVGGGGAGGGATYGYKEVTASESNWTVPEGVTKLRVFLIGGGGGGASAGSGNGIAYADIEAAGNTSDKVVINKTQTLNLTTGAKQKIPELDIRCKNSKVEKWTLVSNNEIKITPNTPMAKINAYGGGGGGGGARGTNNPCGGGGGGGGYIENAPLIGVSSINIKIGAGGSGGSAGNGGTGGGATIVNTADNSILLVAAGGGGGGGDVGYSNGSRGNGGAGGAGYAAGSGASGGNGGKGGAGYTNIGGITGIAGSNSKCFSGGATGSYNGSGGGGGGAGGDGCTFGLGGGGGGAGGTFTSYKSNLGIYGRGTSGNGRTGGQNNSGYGNGGNGICSSGGNGSSGGAGSVTVNYGGEKLAKFLQCAYVLPTNSGAGGGSGQIWIGELTVTPGQKLNFNIGIGGSKTTSYGSNGNNGGNTSITNTNGTTLISVSGGKGGRYESDETYINNSYGIGGGIKTSNVDSSFAKYVNWKKTNFHQGGENGGVGKTPAQGAGGGKGGQLYDLNGILLKGGNESGAQTDGYDAPNTSYGAGGGGGGGVINDGGTPGYGGRGANGYIYVEWGGSNGGGGASGQIVTENSVWVTPGTKIQITVGKGGEPKDTVINNGQLGQKGNNGGDSFVTTNEGKKAVAKGGEGGYPGTSVHGMGGNYDGKDENGDITGDKSPNYIENSIKGENGTDDYGGMGGTITEEICPLFDTLMGLGGCGGNMPNGNCNGASSTGAGKNAGKVGGGGGGGAVKDNTAYTGGKGANGMVVIEWNN